MSSNKVTKEQIEEMIRKGLLKNEILWHHYREISACQQSIENLLEKLETEGFKGFEVYYAFLTHVYYMRFAFEDAGMEKVMQDVDKEVFQKMLEHRKKYPKHSHAGTVSVEK